MSMLSVFGLATEAGIVLVSIICHPVILLIKVSALTFGCQQSGSSQIWNSDRSLDGIARLCMHWHIEERAFHESIADKDLVPACCLLPTSPRSGPEFLPHVLICRNLSSVKTPRYYRLFLRRRSEHAFRRQQNFCPRVLGSAR